MSKIPIRPFSFITIVFLLMFPAKGTARVHHVDRIGNDANQKVLPAGAAVISGTVTDAG